MTSSRLPGTNLIIPSCVLGDDELISLVNAMENVRWILKDEDESFDATDFDKAIADCRDELIESRGLVIVEYPHERAPQFYINFIK